MAFGISLGRIKLVHRAWRYRLRHDREEIRYLLTHLRAAEVAVDIGAHKGAYTYWMRKRVGPAGRVFAFEPQPDLAARLKRAFSSPVLANVVVENMGLSSRPGELVLHVPGAQPSPGATLEHRAAHGQTAYAVRVDTLDRYFLDGSNLDPDHRVAFIKCDVEGHELEVFRGGERLLHAHRPILLFECEQRHHFRDSVASVFDALTQMRYKGAFFEQGRLADVGGFDPARHQSNLQSGYVNNFVFLPADKT